MRLARVGVVAAVMATAWLASEGSAAAATCDPIQAAANANFEAQLAFTKQAYSDGVITAEEYAQADVYLNNARKYGDDLLLCIQTGVLPPGYVNAPPGGVPDDSKIRAVCGEYRNSIGELARVNKRRRDVVPAGEYIERFTQRTGWIVGGVGHAAPPGLKTAFKLLGAAYGSLNDITKYTLFRNEEEIKATDRQVAYYSKSYNAICKEFESTPAASFAAWPAPGLVGSIAARPASLSGRPSSGPTSSGLGALVRTLRRTVNSEDETFKKLKAAMQTLHSHRTEDQAAPAADVAAVRKQAAKAVKLIGQLQRLRKSLAGSRAVKQVRLQARNLPAKRRQDKYIRRFINKPASKALATKELARAEQRLIALLKAQPLLP